MTTVVTRGAASAQALGYASSSAAVNYVEDVFSTYLYTGNGSTQTITNGIDLAGEGGLTWIKQRTGGFLQSNWLMDTVRGAGQAIRSDTTNASVNVQSDFNQVFLSSGFSFNATSGAVNGSGNTYASWTFRKQPKFFDIVTYTGDGVAGRTVAHNLGSVPGCIIVKATSVAGQDWLVYHRSLATNGYLLLNSTGAASVYPYVYNPTTTTFDVASSVATNGSGTTYVAYLFAHNAGGFGLTGTDNVISCGSYARGSTINLGFEPQLLITKRYDGEGNWDIFDNMRDWSLTNQAYLAANTSAAENFTGDGGPEPTATGFTTSGGGANHIYIAIRRGPMKVPTVGTEVFAPVAYTGTGANNRQIGTSTFVVDYILGTKRNTIDGKYFYTRLQGNGAYLSSTNTNAEAGAGSTLYGPQYGKIQLGYQQGSNDGLNLDNSGDTFINYLFRRAPGFFDEVCWTGDGANPRSISHNLTVAPTLIITKKRNSTSNWITGYDFATTTYKYFYLNDTSAANSDTYASTPVYGGNPTASVFIVGNQGNINQSGDTYVSYLFATCAGVSKVGSYTGTGTTLQINCGFTAGSRFVMIKRTDSTGDWYVWDSARGIVAGNDPFLWLNSTAAENTSTDYVDTYSAGFEISSTAPAAINANGGSFIFFAVS